MMPLYRSPTNTVTVRKNTGANVGSRGRLNLIEGAGVTLTVTDDAGSSEVDVTIAAVDSPTGTYTLTGVNADRAIDADATTLNEALNVLGTLIQDLQTQGIVG